MTRTPGCITTVEPVLGRPDRLSPNAQVRVGKRRSRRHRKPERSLGGVVDVATRGRAKARREVVLQIQNSEKLRLLQDRQARSSAVSAPDADTPSVIFDYLADEVLQHFDASTQ